MREGIRPYQFVKEDKEDDFLIFKGNRWYVHTYYGGVAETTKEYWESVMGARE